MAIPAYVGNLKTRRAAICAELSVLSATAPGGKPNAGGNGSTVDHTGYKKSLYDELAQIDDAIRRAGETAAAEDIAANGPWEIEQEYH